MGGAYKRGLKENPRPPGAAAGEECEGPDCERTESSGWWADGRCCSRRDCKRHFGVLGKENKKPSKRQRLATHSRDSDVAHDEHGAVHRRGGDTAAGHCVNAAKNPAHTSSVLAGDRKGGPGCRGC